MNNHVQVELEYDSIHDISLGLLKFLEEHDIEPLEATAAVTMTLGRLSADGPITPDVEIAFVQYMGEVTQAYFATGAVN
jgi:hypothetical protein